MPELFDAYPQPATALTAAPRSMTLSMRCKYVVSGAGNPHGSAGGCTLRS